jgi:glycosyltransferase involved in cell wall biosynthesis
MPSLSVCIPCYQSERFIRTTIESALNQTSPADEIVISDDNSPDNSFEIIHQYQHLPRVRIIRPPHRITLGEHYRFVLEHATTDYVCFLSSDDALLPHFVATMRAAMEPGVALIAASTVEADSHLVPTRIKGANLPKNTFSPPAGYFHFTIGNTYIISVSVFNRELLLTVPPLPHTADLATDWYWALSMGTRGKIKFVRQPMGYYRVHDSNAANTNHLAWRKSTYAMLTFLQTHLSPDLSRALDKEMGIIQEQLKDNRPPDTPSGAKEKLKELAKKLLAARYRTLPTAIRQAEAGIGVSLR